MDFIHYNPEFDYYPDSEINDERDEDLTMNYGYILQLTGLDSCEPVFDVKMEEPIKEPIKVEPTMEVITTDFSAISITDNSKKKNKYGPEQIRAFIELIQEEGLSVPKAAKQCMIPKISAYLLLKEFNAGSDDVLSGKSLKKKANIGTSVKFLPEHTEFLVNFFDKISPSTLEMAKEALCKDFVGFTISSQSLWKHLKESCRFSLKQASKYNANRSSERTLLLCHDIVRKWKENGADFQKNCVFIDEAGFHTQMMRSRAQSTKKGDPVIIQAHSRRGANVTIVGCISPFGTINLSKVEPLNRSDMEKLEEEFKEHTIKKRKANVLKKFKSKPLKKGTTTCHVVKFFEAVMDVLDKYNKKGMFIVMGNCRIHHSAFVVDAINKR
ncbi:hypothetical protein G6F56_011357 [Rhizopus delemar]|nr:hypothetical protein G6F56_011357 [Rhizopus delemar]